MARVLADCAARGKLYYGTVGQKSGALNEPEMAQLLRAARANGRLHLLLSHSCDFDQTDAVGDAWDRAAERALSVD
jgi:hypothetical protein